MESGESKQDVPIAGVALEDPVARVRSRVAAERAARAPLDRKSMLSIGAVLLAFAYLLVDASINRPSSYVPLRSGPLNACTADDAQCLGSRISASIQEPCSSALLATVSMPTRWDSGFELRFDKPAWYQPGSSLIFYGSSLVVTKANGEQQRVSYFCAVDAATGSVRKAGVPDLI